MSSAHYLRRRAALPVARPNYRFPAPSRNRHHHANGDASQTTWFDEDTHGGAIQTHLRREMQLSCRPTSSGTSRSLPAAIVDSLFDTPIVPHRLCCACRCFDLGLEATWPSWDESNGTRHLRTMTGNAVSSAYGRRGL
ncbi:hypothetical protein CGMCC3_g17143 [Colletotrichum fructicola]|nr:uncharacterized protein CGMCC3_g17143 [Colletotrichum fructicola]KAE9566696.1 hypothetical protein CGMCC3_g17143 [Colletotrichum fructicola]